MNYRSQGLPMETSEGGEHFGQGAIAAELLVREMLQPQRPPVAVAQRVVIKLGTRVLTDDFGHLDMDRLERLVATMAHLHATGRDVLLVSSGAVGLGRGTLGVPTRSDDFEVRRACAAVGQTQMMAFYQQAFARYGLNCGQILLSPGDFADRERYLDLRSTLTAMLRNGVLPILNENDALTLVRRDAREAEERPIFADNDRLAALVATKLGADLLVLLTDIDGVYDRDPRRPGARLVRQVDDPKALVEIAGGSASNVGRGGMRSKVQAACVAVRGGCQAVIASGRSAGALSLVLGGYDVGTWFPAAESLEARRRWIAFAALPTGVLHLDDGAVAALRGGRASLLPVGVQKVEGEFRRGDVVELRDVSGALVGRGMALCNASVARQWCSGHPWVDDLYGHRALVRRSHVVLEQ